MQPSLDLDDSPEVHHVHGAEVRLWRAFSSPTEATEILDALRAQPGWRQDRITLYGRSHPIPRMHRWFATHQQSYRWSGIDMLPEAFPSCLDRVREQLRTTTGTSFNTALANLYRDGADGMGWHADDERTLGKHPAIASYTVGETRRFLMRRKDDHSARLEFALDHGSLLLMSGATQELWEHSVPKTKKPRGPRINLTFRRMQP